MKSSATRSRPDSVTKDANSTTAMIAKKRRLDNDLRNLYEDFGTVMDDYEETEYGEDSDKEEEYEMDYHEDPEYGSECCATCSGDMPMEDEPDEEDEDGIDEGDDFDQDHDDEYSDHDGDSKEEKSEAKLKEKVENNKDGEGAAKAIEDGGGETELDEVMEPIWHPLFKPDAPKVVLLSNDNQNLYVDRHILSTYSDVFKDLFSLPASDMNIDKSQPIFIDEKAEVLALMLSDIHEHDFRSRVSSLRNHDIAINYSVLQSHDKFQVPVAREAADRRMEDHLNQDPYAVFAFASRQNDLELGRRAIRSMDLFKASTPYGSRVDFWSKIKDARPNWQVALAVLVMPDINITRDKLYQGMITKARRLDMSVESDMEDIAECFSPEEWH